MLSTWLSCIDARHLNTAGSPAMTDTQQFARLACSCLTPCCRVQTTLFLLFCDPESIALVLLVYGQDMTDLDIQDAGCICTVADDRAHHKGGADGDQVKTILFASLPCCPLSCNLHCLPHHITSVSEMHVTQL